MFCLDFAPQARSENAYGQRAYVGDGESELNPQYSAHVDLAVEKAQVGTLCDGLFNVGRTSRNDEPVFSAAFA